MLIQRHYIKEFSRLYLLMCLGLGAVMSMIDLVSNMDKFMPYDPPASMLARYMAYSLPGYIVYLMPMASLLCVLFTLGRAARNREIVTIMAAGGRLRTVMLPFVAAGLVLSLMGFALSEFVVPLCARNATGIERQIRQIKQWKSMFHEGSAWLRGPGGDIVMIDLYTPEGGLFKGMEIYIPGESGIAKVIKAAQASYMEEEKTWALSGVSIYNFDEGTMSYQQQMPYEGLSSPSVFMVDAKQPYEMGMVELGRYIDRLMDAGFRNVKLSVQYHSKASYPLINLFMAVLGTALAVRRNMGGMKAAATGILIILLYWLGFSLMLTLGYSGVLPPFMAVWAMPLVFGALSAHQYLHMKE